MATSTFTPTNPSGWQSWFDYISQQKQKPEYRGGADLGSSYQYWLKNIRDLPKPVAPMGANQPNAMGNAPPTEPVNSNQLSNLAQGWGSALQNQRINVPPAGATTTPPPAGVGGERPPGGNPLEPVGAGGTNPGWAGGDIYEPRQPGQWTVPGANTAKSYNPPGAIDFIRNLFKKIVPNNTENEDTSMLIYWAEPVPASMISAFLTEAGHQLLTRPDVTPEEVRKFLDYALDVSVNEKVFPSGLTVANIAALRPGEFRPELLPVLQEFQGKVKTLYDAGEKGTYNPVWDHLKGLSTAPEMDRWTGKMIPNAGLNRFFSPIATRPAATITPENVATRLATVGLNQGDVGKPISPLGGEQQQNLGAQQPVQPTEPTQTLYTSSAYQPQNFLNDLQRSLGYNQQIPQPPQPTVYSSQYGKGWGNYL